MKIISTDKAPSAVGPYSQAIEANNTLYVSGQIPLCPKTMTFPSEGIKEQTRQSLENVGAVLEAAGYSFKNVVKATVFITNMAYFADVNEIYAEYLGDIKPARACVEVAALPKGAKVEVEVIAVK